MHPAHGRPRGALIAIEGGDGTGKGTLIAALVPGLRVAGIDVVATREPGGTEQGLMLRQLLLPEAASWEPWAELLLMAAARVQHVARVIRPAVEAGSIVVTDRFVGSTIAYQGAGRGLPIGEIVALHHMTSGDLQPDLTIVLDADPASALRRGRARLVEQHLDEGRFEAMDMAFHRRVRASFLAQAAASPATHLVVDAGRTQDEVATVVLDAVRGWLATRVRRRSETG